MYVCMYVCACLCVRAYVCVCAHVHVCVPVRVCVCVLGGHSLSLYCSFYHFLAFSLIFICNFLSFHSILPFYLFLHPNLFPSPLLIPSPLFTPLPLFSRDHKSDMVIDLKEELEQVRIGIQKLQTDKRELAEQAKTARAYRDEIEMLKVQEA